MTVTYFGSLSNFDVVNNSTGPCNGFEIELDGLTSKEITYTFDYQSYGTPRLVDSLDANGKPVVKVRYESKYNPVTHTFLNSTPIAPVPTMTTIGHPCQIPRTPVVVNTMDWALSENQAK